MLESRASQWLGKVNRRNKPELLDLLTRFCQATFLLKFVRLRRDTRLLCKLLQGPTGRKKCQENESECKFDYKA